MGTLLLIDIGNTSITIGLYERGFKEVFRLRTVSGRSVREYKYIIEGLIAEAQRGRPEGVVICSVVPDITPLLAGAVKECLGLDPINVSNRIETGLKFSIKNPDELGADRIASAVAAHRLYEGNKVIVDFGTATTFCVVTAGGEYRGGTIMPGLDISVDALSRRTAKLPRIEPGSPERVIGRDTREGILAGVVIGHAGATERILHEITEELGEPVVVIATGGLADLVVPYIKGIKEVNQFLLLEGLRFIYELNS